MRGLQVKRIGRSLYAVSSHSRPGRWHRVTLDSCGCEATDYCSHRAAAFNEEMLNEAGSFERIEYLEAQRRDFAELELRLLHGRETSEDRRFARPHAERVAMRYATETEKRDYAPQF